MATRSFGTKASVGGTDISGLNSLSLSGVDVNFIDTTAWDTAGGYRTFLGGLKDGGTVDLGGLYDGTAGQADLRDDGGDTVAVVVTLIGGNTFSFSGIIGPFGVSADDDGVVSFTSSIKISGPITAGSGGGGGS